jgi:seryl-tRNA synthetase
MNIDFILDRETEYCDMMSKRFKDPSIINSLKNLRKSYVDKLVELEHLNRAHNDCSKLISTVMKSKNVTDKSKETLDKMFENSPLEFDYNDVDLTVAMIKNRVKDIQSLKLETMKIVDQYLEQIKLVVSEIPNLLHESVPISDNEDNNAIVFQTEISEKKKYGQYELCLKTGIYESATEIAGNRGYFLANDGVKLNTALLMYAQDFIRARGYKVMQTPFFMTQEAMKTVCQLSDFDETLYKVKDGKSSSNDELGRDEDKYLIATSEQPLTAYFNGKKLTDLPVRLSGVSSCFRREAGKHGKDTNGIFRVHQFEKVEQFCVTNAESSYEMMEEMLQNAKDFYESLGLQYRVVSIVSGALNNAASKKYDIEGWFPGSGEFRELVSCSNTTDYFSRRLRCKNNLNEMCHMLNSTLYANTRTICCLLEMGQTENGISIPDVLVPYFGKNFIPYI